MMNRLTLNYILFLVLSFIIIFGFQYFFNKPEEKEKTAQEQTAQEKAAPQAETTPAPKQPVKQAPRTVNNTEKYKSLAASKENGSVISVNSPLYSAKRDTLGGRVIDWQLKAYNQTTAKDSPLVNLINKDNQLATSIALKNRDLPYLIPFKYSGQDTIDIEDSNKGILLTYTDPAGVKISKTIEFDAANYLLNESITVDNLSSEGQEYNIVFNTFGSVEQQGRGENSNELIVLLNQDVERIKSEPEQHEQLSGQIGWFGFGNKYFFTAIIPELGGNNVLNVSTVDGNKLINAEYSYPREAIKPGSGNTTKWKVYLGPKEEKNLKAVGYDLDLAIYYGWLGILAKIAVKFLKILNSVFHNYGVSIIAITVILRVLFLPLTLKSMRSMKKMQFKMQEVKPKIDALKEKYKDDKTKQNAELMKLYTSHGINPLSSLGGCFPLLLQLPVFIALDEALLYSIDLRQSSFLWISDLAEPEHLFDIPVFGDFSIPFRILPLAMGISWFISQKMTPMSAPASESMELQMKMMQFMPIIFTVMFWGLPSGLILYWTVSNILSIGQQIYINRTEHVVNRGG